MTRRQAVGYWLTGVLIVGGVAGVIGLAMWADVRTSTQEMEGGWERTVIDQEIPWGPYVLAGFVIAATLWTLAFIAYHLIHTETKTPPVLDTEDVI